MTNVDGDPRFSPKELEAWAQLEERWQGVLENRMRELRVDRVPFAPCDDDLVIYRMQPREQKTESGIVLPQVTMTVDRDERTGQRTTRADERVIHMGLLMAAGCQARDWMRSHGVLVGDIVKWGKWAGEEENLHWFSGGQITSLQDVLLMNVRDLRGSFDLDMRLQEGLMRIVYVSSPDWSGHIVKPVVKET